MTKTWDSALEEIRQKVDLVAIIEETGPEYKFDTRQRGKYRYCLAHDSLAVDEAWGRYTWFSKAGQNGHEYETGDAFDWLQRYRGMTFRQAVEYLAGKYGVSLPEREGGENAGIAAVRLKTEALTVAAAWFERQLWKTQAALAYARGRGWTDETLRRESEREGGGVVRGAGIGYSGGNKGAGVELRSWLAAHGVDTTTPAAVALCGYQGDVAAWCERHGIQPQENWVRQGRIYGLTDFQRLIYPHWSRGRVTYFSGRNLVWEEKRLVGEKGKMKAYNPPRALMGERQYYANWLYHRRSEAVVIVEGPADAITLGQWGYPAIALMGLGADERLAEMTAEVGTVYLALDADKRGQAAVRQAAAQLGPLTRIVDWSALESMA